MDNSTTISKKILETDISELLGLDALTELERYAYLSDVSDTVFEGAVSRFLGDLSEEDLNAVNVLLESSTDTETVLQQLMERYPAFSKSLEEEIVDFRESAIELFADAA